MAELRFSACPVQDTTECQVGFTMAADGDTLVPFCGWREDCPAPVLRREAEVIGRSDEWLQVDPNQFREERGGF